MNKKLKDLLERIEVEKQAAWDAGLIGRVDFMLELNQTLRELSLVVIAVNGMLSRSNDEPAWTAMMEALDECGLLMEEEPE